MGESTLYQHQTLGDLMAGVFDGTLTFEELLKHGDIGIGTFHDFEGELILLDGVAYRAKEDGSISGVDTVFAASVPPAYAYIQNARLF